MMWIERTSLLSLTSPRRSARLNLVVASTALLILILFPTASPAVVQASTRWEQSLTSAKAYANPSADVTLKVTYRGPEQGTITGLGFWDGGNTFKLRCLFPKAGHWTWQTTCSDTNNTGLHGQRGSVEVRPYPGVNPLYRHGCLRVATNHRHLTYADGTPFLWIGDTAWAAPMNATMEDWQTYVRDRASKKFTILQVFPASDWAGTNDWQGNAPFVGEGLSRINPACAIHGLTKRYNSFLLQIGIVTRFVQHATLASTAAGSPDKKSKAISFPSLLARGTLHTLDYVLRP